MKTKRVMLRYDGRWTWFPTKENRQWTILSSFIDDKGFNRIHCSIGLDALRSLGIIPNKKARANTMSIVLGSDNTADDIMEALEFDEVSRDRIVNAINVHDEFLAVSKLILLHRNSGDLAGAVRALAEVVKKAEVA